jgi:hypothetical protein
MLSGKILSGMQAMASKGSPDLCQGAFIAVVLQIRFRHLHKVHDKNNAGFV